MCVYLYSSSPPPSSSLSFISKIYIFIYVYLCIFDYFLLYFFLFHRERESVCASISPLLRVAAFVLCFAVLCCVLYCTGTGTVQCVFRRFLLARSIRGAFQTI